MWSLAVDTTKTADIRVPVERSRTEDDIDILLNELVSQLWATYRDMARPHLH